MKYQAYVSYQAEPGAKWAPVPVLPIERRTLNGARADALASFAALALDNVHLYARIVRTSGRGRKVAETLSV